MARKLGRTPATVLNSVMTITRAGGAIGIPGLYVTDDQAADANAKTGNLSIASDWAGRNRIRSPWPVPVRYNRALMNAVLYDKFHPAKAECDCYFTRRSAQGLSGFDKAQPRVRHRSAQMVV
jgi:glutathione-independent formaldehyde dehydrogenase